MMKKSALTLLSVAFMASSLVGCASHEGGRPTIDELKKSIVQAEGSLEGEELDPLVTCLAEGFYNSKLSDKTLSKVVKTKGKFLMESVDSLNEFERDVVTSPEFVLHTEECYTGGIPTETKANPKPKPDTPVTPEEPVVPEETPDVTPDDVPPTATPEGDASGFAGSGQPEPQGVTPPVG